MTVHVITASKHGSTREIADALTEPATESERVAG